MIDWDAAWVEHRGWLRTIIVARVKEPQAVEEVLQEVACAVMTRRPALEDLSKVGPWLYRVAVLQSIRYRRRQARQRRGLARYAVHCDQIGVSVEAITPLRLLLAEERRQVVEAAMKRLSGRDTELLMLKYLERWSYRQLAEHLGISESAVDGRLQRARERLRAELSRYEGSED
jgi:RNA polymerase sigma-70 factor (ECF subfamily)